MAGLSYHVRSRRRIRGAFTLLELIASMAVMTLVLGGIATSLVLASRAIPDEDSPLETPMQSFRAAEEVANDLYVALNFTERSANVAEFTVADRNGDGGDELIRLEWSGVAGEPLIRTYNAGTATVMASNVHEFNLTYWTASRTDQTDSDTSTTGNETILAYFENWPGIVATAQEVSVTATSWVSEYFEIAPPAYASKLIFTQARITMKRGLSIPLGTSDLSVGIYQASSGDTTPVASSLGSPTVLRWNELSTSFIWQQIAFAGVEATDFTKKGYCLVVKGGLTGNASVRELWDKTAPSNGVIENWTTLSGVTWNPTTGSINKQDIRFYVYGKYVTFIPAGTEYQREFVKGVGITVLVGSEPAARATTGVELLNVPEIPVS